MLIEDLTFRERLATLPKEELLAIIKEQNPQLIQGIKRIEWVFTHKMGHLTWNDGEPIIERPLINEELALLVDEPFTPDAELTRLGISIEEQRKLHIARDPVMWARDFLGVEPRVYQILMLRHPKLRKVLRAGRRLGKTYMMAIALLHYAYTHNFGRCLVVTPMKSQAEVIYDELMRMVKSSPAVFDSVTRNVTSPQYHIELSNGSSIRFFTSGMKSGGKADVVRGQEAHLIVLDELDYMHPDDLTAIYAMLQKTDENQPDKVLIGASTPTGQRTTPFYIWCTHPKLFKEFWFPSFCNPFFTKEVEAEFRAQYSEMQFRHEIEADWGEDTEGVYPRKYVDASVVRPGWEYKADITSARSFFVIGVDWDKYAAGTNIVVLEVCQDDYEDPSLAGKIRVVFREETHKEEYSLTKSVDRIIELNKIFNPKFIYVDRGFGEVQVELFHKYGVEHPESGLRKKVVGVQFSETFEMRDPASKQIVKKDIKPFMVDNFRQMMEKDQFRFPEQDEELYIQITSYVVDRVTPTGRPVFVAGGAAKDHAHDALILACFAITQNFGDLMKLRLARGSVVVSNEAFLPMFTSDSDRDDDIAKNVWGSLNRAPVFKRRTMSVNMNRAGKITRKVF